MSPFTNAMTSWLVNLSAVAGFFSWLGMNITYLYFCECSVITTCDMPPLTHPPNYRPWHEGPGLRPHQASVLQQSPALAIYLGHLLAHRLHPRQRPTRVLELQRLRFPHQL
jgi:hypothetical protein